MSGEKPKGPKKVSRGPYRESDYDVGYGRPPQNTRFKKGQGGWPKGKKRGPRQQDKSVDAAFGRTVAITEGGVRKKVSVKAALVTKLQQAALNKDDLKTSIAYIKLADAHEARHLPQGAPIEDEKVQAMRREMNSKLIGVLGFMEQLMDTGGLEFGADGAPIAKGWLRAAMAGQPSSKDKKRVRFASGPKKPQGGNSDPTEGS